ncbi:unnamed protein product [Urochloa decumbens]|uniref:KIB1-4 beta-propeller domain-containing protein n=1 Tax=Urochloa decumbens TaxID=240449 RepID=A0ABC9FWU6_9POAL
MEKRMITFPCSSTQIQSQVAKRKYLSHCASWGAKRARSALGGADKHALSGASLPPPPHNNNTAPASSTDWANLGDGPAGRIAEFALATDVADYVRFHAACRPWRRCSPDPRAGGLDSRFLPRDWIMLDKALAGPRCRRFLNVSTGECIRMDLLELDDHRLLALTPEGLLLLLHEATLAVRLLNPLTHHLTDLPRLNALLQARGYESARSLRVYGVGLVADASAVAVCFSCPMVLAVAKPGDKSWTVVNEEYMYSALPFAERFYCATCMGAMVLNSSDQQLVMVADLSKSFGFSQMAHSLHLVDNGGELMLVHRIHSNYMKKYDVYRVDVEAGILIPVKSFNGRDVFMGMRRTISVYAGVFPLVNADTIYLGWECDSQILRYNIADGSGVPCQCSPILGYRLCPDSAIDCLCNCIQGIGDRLA